MIDAALLNVLADFTQQFFSCVFFFFFGLTPGSVFTGVPVVSGGAIQSLFSKLLGEVLNHTCMEEQMVPFLYLHANEFKARLILVTPHPHKRPVRIKGRL